MTPGTARIASTTSIAWSPLAAEQVRSMTSRSWRDSTMSSAVVMPPASLTAVASWPTTAGSVPEWMRTVIE